MGRKNDKESGQRNRKKDKRKSKEHVYSSKHVRNVENYSMS